MVKEFAKYKDKLPASMIEGVKEKTKATREIIILPPPSSVQGITKVPKPENCE